MRVRKGFITPKVVKTVLAPALTPGADTPDQNVNATRDQIDVGIVGILKAPKAPHCPLNGMAEHA